MMQLQGNWFDGNTSAHSTVVLRVDDQGLVSVYTEPDQSLQLQCHFNSLEVSARVGNTPRYIYFPNGEKLETTSQDVVDELLQRYRPSVFNTLAHRLESHLQFVLVTLVAVVLISWSAMQYGVPAAARFIAQVLPAQVMDRAATETLQLLDKLHFSPTQLPPSVQARVLEHFAPAIAEDPSLNIRVVFRQGGDIGANAFALPDGTLVFTDEIVGLAQDDDELLAVLAHEIGHVKYRHSLRAAIQGSALSFAVAMLTGDLSTSGNLLAALPLILTTMSYSRDFEREADGYSLVFLDKHHIKRHHFIHLMERLQQDAHCTMLLADADADADADKVLP